MFVFSYYRHGKTGENNLQKQLKFEFKGQWFRITLSISKSDSDMCLDILPASPVMMQKGKTKIPPQTGLYLTVI